jgi:ubiquinone/menaquinone biosynthesis C-methylase UbiE
MSNHSDRELAFIHDLYIAPDWGERFAELIDEHITLPREGRALYVGSGTGGHALAMQERAGKDLHLVCVDESQERLELARAKARALKIGGQTEFHLMQPEALDFADDQFDLVMGDASLVAPERLPEILEEMVRVAAPGGTVAINIPTASSFGEFFSIYWEALCNAGFAEQASIVEDMINELPTVSDMEAMAAGAGLDDVRSWTRIEEFDFASGKEFINAPLITSVLLKGWLEPLPDNEARARVSGHIERLIDEERHNVDFALSIKATLVAGRKAQ